MFLVAALDTPTQSEIDDVIREAEQLLIDAVVLDEQTGTTVTPRAPVQAAWRQHELDALDGAPRSQRRLLLPSTQTPWARSPPRRSTVD